MTDQPEKTYVPQQIMVGATLPMTTPEGLGSYSPAQVAVGMEVLRMAKLVAEAQEDDPSSLLTRLRLETLFRKMDQYAEFRAFVQRGGAAV